MLQSHSLILWSYANIEDFEVSLKKADDLLSALRKFGPELSPNYSTVYRKRDAKPLDWKPETLEKLLKKGVNKEGNKIFLDLGYGLSFFSNLNDNDSAGISLTVGTSNPKFKNNFHVDLPLSLPIYDDEQVNNRLITVFKECIKVFNPFGACISNDVNIRSYDGYWNDGLPTAIHWVNYFDDEISKRLGENRIMTSPISEKEKFHTGYFLMLKNKPINVDFEDDIILQQKANEYFRLV